MTWLTLAAKNVRHQSRSYGAFFLSAAFAVWLFFLYGSLLFHPDLAKAKLPSTIYSLMAVMELIVALFSVLFILYAHAAFLKTRRRELGLLTTLGMLPRQIAGVIWRENSLIGLGAIVTGLGVGTVSARLFFLAIGKVLAMTRPLPFHFAWQAAVLTIAGFGLVFGIISGRSLLSLRRLSIAAVFREAVKPKAPPRFSSWLAGLGFVALGTAYGLAFATAGIGDNVGLTMVVAALVGTYLLFSQGGAFILRALQRRRSLYWRGAGLITISQLVYKLKDNARILFMVCTLSATVITSVSLLGAAYAQSAEMARQHVPISLMIVGEPKGLGPAEVEALLERHGLAWSGSAALPALRTVLQPAVRGQSLSASGLAVVPVGAFNRWLAALTQAPPLDVQPGKATVVMYGREANLPEDALRLVYRDFEPWHSGFAYAGPAAEVPLGEVRVLPAFNLTTGIMSLVAVVDDATFAGLAGRYGTQATTVHGWEIPGWQKMAPVLDDLRRAMGEQPDPVRDPHGVSSTVAEFLQFKQANGFMFFLLCFCSVLFFLASGNMLYFKLFTDLQEDRREFQALYKLGLKTEEVRHIVSVQTAVLFFAPLAVAAAHSLVILLMVDNIARSTLFPAFGLVTLAYLLLHGAYFLVTRQAYVKTVLT